MKTFGNWENGEHLGFRPVPLGHLSAPPHLIKEEDDHDDHGDHDDHDDHDQHNDNQEEEDDVPLSIPLLLIV